MDSLIILIIIIIPLIAIFAMHMRLAETVFKNNDALYTLLRNVELGIAIPANSTEEAYVGKVNGTSLLNVDNPSFVQAGDKTLSYKELNPPPQFKWLNVTVSMAEDTASSKDESEVQAPKPPYF